MGVHAVPCPCSHRISCTEELGRRLAPGPACAYLGLRVVALLNIIFLIRLLITGYCTVVGNGANDWRYKKMACNSPSLIFA